MKRQNYNIPVGSIVIIVVSFLLAIFDMLFLYSAVQKVFGQPRFMAMLTSFTIATIANFNAFMWGKDNGEKQNKKMTAGGIIWVLIGVGYAVIRAIDIIKRLDSPELNLLGDLFQIAFLGLIYPFTGLEIRKNAAIYFDADAIRYRRARKEFEEYHKLLAKTETPIVKDMAILKNYNKHYKSLTAQRNEIYRGIEKTEKATAAAITGLVLKNNPVIDATATHNAMEQTLKEARDKFDNKKA